jgi:hypothetical protein
MYQINQRAQAPAILTSRMQQLAAASRQHTPQLRAALAKLADLATLRVMLGSSFDAPERPDPRDPRSW